jgi:hypothetical protein
VQPMASWAGYMVAQPRWPERSRGVALQHQLASVALVAGRLRRRGLGMAALHRQPHRRRVADRAAQGELEVLNDASARAAAADSGTSGPPSSCAQGKEEQGERRSSTLDEATAVAAHRR